MRYKQKTELRRCQKTVKEIEALENRIHALSDKELQEKSKELKEKARSGTALEKLLPEAFALVREAADRTLHLKAFPVQIAGGIALHHGFVAEMKTGEGKTLAATMPAYLNALTGRGVHIVTVNDYLAKRDAEEMGKIFRFLGLTVGVILHDMTLEERKEAYGCDITYVTNQELGFDYLKDHLAVHEKGIVQRGLVYAIIDEVDSILIDEARTPLIISGGSEKSTKLYEVCDQAARQLKPSLNAKEYVSNAQADGDYIVNEKEKTVTLTGTGIKKIEKIFQIDNLSSPENTKYLHHMTLALRAHAIMHRDRDYVVKEDQICIVDEFTGRILPGRRYSDGLHQAIEAKEHVTIQKENRTRATITFQSFFNKYEKKAGMTGTAMTEWREFKDIYHMDAVCIPTNKPVIRKDLPDVVFKTKKEKYGAVIQDIEAAKEIGQPVLVGTANIETSEHLSRLLNERNIAHHVLNAKYHEKEAQIIAQAGKAGAVTIATNMAGRGTDIKLDEQARKAGGLKVIGTERHEARRIDHQLRGRSGRQGDPGTSVFYLSLEDDILRLFGTEKWISVFRAIGNEDGEPIQHKMLVKAIRKAQKSLESNNFTIRKNLTDYDSVMNEQRDIIYKERSRILAGDDTREDILGMLREYVHISAAASYDDIPRMEESMRRILPDFTLEENNDKKDLENTCNQILLHAYKNIENSVSDIESLRNVERHYILREIDEGWINQINDLELLKQGIQMQSLAQKDPKTEYKMIGYQLFAGMTRQITEAVLKDIFQIPMEIAKAKALEHGQDPAGNRKVTFRPPVRIPEYA